jgi:hypothetical protein
MNGEGRMTTAKQGGERRGTCRRNSRRRVLLLPQVTVYPIAGSTDLERPKCCRQTTHLPHPRRGREERRPLEQAGEGGR